MITLLVITFVTSLIVYLVYQDGQLENANKIKKISKKIMVISGIMLDIIGIIILLYFILCMIINFLF